jgi:hypothetical protein
MSEQELRRCVDSAFKQGHDALRRNSPIEALPPAVGDMVLTVRRRTRFPWTFPRLWVLTALSASLVGRAKFFELVSNIHLVSNTNTHAARTRTARWRAPQPVRALGLPRRARAPARTRPLVRSRCACATEDLRRQCASCWTFSDRGDRVRDRPRSQQRRRATAQKASAWSRARGRNPRASARRS